MIIQVETDDLFQVIRKYEQQEAHLLSIQSAAEAGKYIVHYAVDQ